MTVPLRSGRYLGSRSLLWADDWEEVADMTAAPMIDPGSSESASASGMYLAPAIGSALVSRRNKSALRAFRKTEDRVEVDAIELLLDGPEVKGSFLSIPGRYADD